MRLATCEGHACECAFFVDLDRAGARGQTHLDVVVAQPLLQTAP